MRDVSNRATDVLRVVVEKVPHPVLRLVVTESAEMARLEQPVAPIAAVAELLSAPGAGTSHQDRVGVVKNETHGINLVQLSVGDNHDDLEDQVRVRVQTRGLHVDPKPGILDPRSHSSASSWC